MTNKHSKRFSSEVRARAVRMFHEHRGAHASEWEAMVSIASKIGCTGETLRKWIRQDERDRGVREGLSTEDRERVKAFVKRRPVLRAKATPRFTNGCRHGHLVGRPKAERRGGHGDAVFFRGYQA